MRTVYLAGPIAGCTSGEANDWRVGVQKKLRNFNIMGISPLRCEPLRGERYADAAAFAAGSSRIIDPRFGTARAIASKNLFDVQNCDMTLAYLPRELNERRPSYGTICEIAWAKMARKQVILVSDDPGVINHPVIDACASWILGTLDEAADVATGILADYARSHF